MRHALWEQLATFDSLIGEFEKLKERYRYEPSSHIKSCVNLGWKKLDQYYGLSDITFAYRTAIFLHLYLRWLGSKGIGDHSGLNLNIQIQKLVFRFNSIQVPSIQYSGFIQYVISWQEKWMRVKI
jgi:hypothetical protein